MLHCPTANLKLGSGIAPVPEYLEAGITVSLGADGAPCNNRLDAFTEMRQAGLIQKPRLGVQALSAEQVVNCATMAGARTLMKEKDLGSIELGKCADLILVNTRNWHNLPCDNPATSLLYGCGSDDVELTMVGGQILFENGSLTHIDEDECRAEVIRERRALENRAGLNL